MFRTRRQLAVLFVTTGVIPVAVEWMRDPALVRLTMVGLPTCIVASVAAGLMVSGRRWRTPFLLVPLSLFSCGGSQLLYSAWYAHHADRVLLEIMRAESAGEPDPRVVGGELLLRSDATRRLLGQGIRSGVCVLDYRGETVGSQDRGFHCLHARSVLVTCAKGQWGGGGWTPS